MPRVNKKLTAPAVAFSVEFLFLSLFANATLSWTAHHALSLLRATSHTSPVKLNSLAKLDGRFVLKQYDKLTPRSGTFLTARETTQFHLRRYAVVPFRVKIILAPKVSRYIAKSVLNI